MKVFDVSEYQPANRVRNLAATEGAEGIIVRLGETLNGFPTLDDKFRRFINDAIMTGLPYGIYYASHAHNMQDFMTEANFINDSVYEYLGGKEPELGTWWDMEVPAVKRDDVWPQLRDAIGTMQSWWNNSQKIGIYAGYSYFYDYLDFNELKYYGIPIWVAQYYKENSLKKEHPELRHVAWQFTTHNETQDENEFYGF